MKTKELFNHLYSNLTPFMEGWGYKLIKSRYEYKNKFANGFLGVGFGYVNYFPEYQLNVRLEVRVNEVMDIVAKFSGGNLTYAKEWVCFGRDIHVLKNAPNNNPDFTDIYTPEDIAEVSLHIKSYLATEGFEFLENCKDLIFLDSYFNDNIFNLHWAIPKDNHALRGITIAKLSARPNYDQLISDYEKLIKNHYKYDPEKHWAIITPLIEYLKTVEPLPSMVERRQRSL
ncbi:MAG TPA: hypothetical protein PK239_18785 [Chitinophagales bacterium]|nr:hypothetical protein [Chitinophagales bacterium]